MGVHGIKGSSSRANASPWRHDRDWVSHSALGRRGERVPARLCHVPVTQATGRLRIRTQRKPRSWPFSRPRLKMDPTTTKKLACKSQGFWILFSSVQNDKNNLYWYLITISQDPTPVLKKRKEKGLPWGDSHEEGCHSLPFEVAVITFKGVDQWCVTVLLHEGVVPSWCFPRGSVCDKTFGSKWPDVSLDSPHSWPKINIYKSAVANFMLIKSRCLG